MKFHNHYKILKTSQYESGNIKIVPIRYEDRLLIMHWRNEQMYHLRQQKVLTETDQNQYFDTVVSKLFDADQPNQLLFSYLKEDVCIGYGGLVHINWKDKNAEISFIIDSLVLISFCSSSLDTAKARTATKISAIPNIAQRRIKFSRRKTKYNWSASKIHFRSW